jgi:isocitrate/isopropylmalate dehydrogenase
MTYVPEVGAAGDRTVTLIPGDGIGPEVAGAVEEVVAALGAPILWDRFPGVSGTCPDGSPALEIDPAVLASIRRNGACFKGTLFTPLTASNTSTQSLNVALRKALDLHVNLVHGFNTPGVPSRWSGLDIVVIRENTEGEYSGLGETKKGGCGERGGESWRERERERVGVVGRSPVSLRSCFHHPIPPRRRRPSLLPCLSPHPEHEVSSPDIVESIKVITAEKSRRTCEFAFGYAFLNGRAKVTAIHKANIMKLGDGMFLREFRAAASRWAGRGVAAEEMIVDNACMQMASHPEQFDVCVSPNLYGNLLGNIVAGITGGPGVVPGVNVGEHVTVFEQGARHVAADIAGRGVANPTAGLLSTVMLLRHLNLPSFSDRLEAAVLGALKDAPASAKTPDLGGKGTTATFIKAVKERL